MANPIQTLLTEMKELREAAQQESGLQWAASLLHSLAERVAELEREIDRLQKELKLRG